MDDLLHYALEVELVNSRRDFLSQVGRGRLWCCACCVRLGRLREVDGERFGAGKTLLSRRGVRVAVESLMIWLVRLPSRVGKGEDAVGSER